MTQDYIDDRIPMDLSKMHTIHELIGKEIECLTHDRFKIKDTQYRQNPKGTLDFKIMFHDVKNPNAELTYRIKMSVEQYLVKQLTREIPKNVKQ
jgi:hypothetical protein